MNHANWNSKTAGRKLPNSDVMNVFDPEETPAITRKLLQLDEAQLDKLTGKRGDIFKQPSRQPSLPEQPDTLELVQRSQDGTGSPTKNTSKTFDSRNRKITYSGAQSALHEAKAELPPALLAQAQKQNVVHEPAR